ncbi:YegS/Rv2252/BmrU family lipid kinase [Salirhabdus euzebyi]|uniref:YegS/Rv2252/BmrU family lipid kinase n=1 Tax=Salirhabdus euzebyi TaxID=394506 RepID=A0A841PYP6_9BACI|nr:YegS/Rv2252/BmrU family lipid kinase [Salirhabdus euzebyi]MBB6452161.1 YegS/Rv2252/BmrU family lipid kinase [Salirhabdus euzebyi]
MYIFIVNVHAGEGKGKKVFEKLKKDKSYNLLESRTFFTEYEGHATALAAQVAKSFGNRITCIVIVGGDGTLHEVMNGVKKYPDVKIAFIPAGSGNDFARGCKLPKKKQKLLFNQIVQYPSWKPYWFGQALKDKSTNKAVLFANSIGFGFDAEVAKRANEAVYKRILNKWNFGTLSYTLALLQVLFSFTTKEMDVIADGQKKSFKKAWMVTITNHPYFGGGMKIVPLARINGDYFYVLVLDNIPRWKVLLLFITVFFGKHTSLKEVHLFKAKHIDIHIKSGSKYQVDGHTGFCHSCSIRKENISRQINRF